MSDQHAGNHERPAVRASDAEREIVVTRLQAAVGEGRLDLDEFADRAAAAYAAVTVAELDALVADIPAHAVEIVGSRPPETVSTVFGDVRLAGAGAPPSQARSVFGDVRIDLRGLQTRAERIELQLSSVFGDIEVIVAEGVDAQLQGSTVFGNRKVDLAPVPRLAGTPRITVQARTVFGDLRLRSLAPGESASRWRALLDRLAQPQPPPLPAPPPPPPPPPLAPPPPLPRLHIPRRRRRGRGEARPRRVRGDAPVSRRPHPSCRSKETAE